jgi:hypothetical protein
MSAAVHEPGYAPLGRSGAIRALRVGLLVVAATAGYYQGDSQPRSFGPHFATPTPQIARRIIWSKVAAEGSPDDHNP